MAIFLPNDVVFLVRVSVVIDSHNIYGDIFTPGNCCNDHLLCPGINMLLSLGSVYKLSSPLHHFIALQTLVTNCPYLQL